MTRTLLQSAALIALLAGPAMAQSTSTELTAGSSTELNDADDSTTLTDDNSAMASAEFDGVLIQMEGDDPMGADVVAVNTAVMTADGATVGMLENVQLASNGQSRLIIRLSEDLGLDVNRVSIGSNNAARVNAAEGITLALSEADFRAAVVANAMN